MSGQGGGKQGKMESRHEGHRERGKKEDGRRRDEQEHELEGFTWHVQMKETQGMTKKKEEDGG